MYGVKYMSCLERIARAVGITLMNEELNVDETTRLIVDRATQLYDYSLHDKQSLIHTLQHKLKSLKERLDLKVSDAPLVMGSILFVGFIYLQQRRRYMFLPVFVCLSVCLSVRMITKNTCIDLDKCCVSIDVGTRTN